MSSSGTQTPPRVGSSKSVACVGAELWWWQDPGDCTSARDKGALSGSSTNLSGVSGALRKPLQLFSSLQLTEICNQKSLPILRLKTRSDFWALISIYQRLGESCRGVCRTPHRPQRPMPLPGKTEISPYFLAEVWSSEKCHYHPSRASPLKRNVLLPVSLLGHNPPDWEPLM